MSIFPQDQYKLLDCTLRDGGYYNNWDFEDELINSYLKSCTDASIDYIEIGFRSLPKLGFAGPLLYSSENFLKTLEIPKKSKLGVMINASELLINDNLEANINSLFPENSKNSKISLVRIACHYDEVKKILKASEFLSDKGYLVALNIMMISERSRQELDEIASLVSSFPVDILYAADSLGRLEPSDISEIFDSLRRNFQGELGIHTHDNLGLALSNSLKAMKEGVTWIDSTITGMGRGPGNCSTEQLLIELSSIDKNKSLSPILFIIENYFNKLKRKYKWGTNSFYYLSGKYGIHPTYVQTLLSDNKYSIDDTLAVIKNLRNKKAKTFKSNILEEGFSFYQSRSLGNWKPTTILQGKEVLIIATGPSSKKYSSYISSFIRNRKPVVIALNTSSFVPNELVDFRIACHPIRLLGDVNEYKKIDSPLICPISALESSISEKLKDKKIYDYGIQLNSLEWKCLEQYCVIPQPLVLLYSISLCISGKASSIYITGADGYPSGDPRNKIIDDSLELLKTNIKLISITPTKYKSFEERSIFGMQL